MSTVLTELLISFRRAIVLLAAENCGLREELLQGYDAPEFPITTSHRVVRAAIALDMVGGQPLMWKEPYRSLASHPIEWKRLLAIISHQQTYLQLAKIVDSEVDNRSLGPASQLAAAPEDYLAFLSGVAASHKQHAEWFVQLEVVRDANHLIDVAGGIGAFSKAWVCSRAGRHATLVDLPGLEPLIHQDSIFSGLVTFLGADLLEAPTLPFGDVYLLANVLHLLPNWHDVLHSVVTQAPESSIIAIMEADPRSPAGVLFDLQVHLRSGGLGGLIKPDDIKAALSYFDLVETCSMETFDPEDPFQRKYIFWLGRKQHSL